MAQMKNIEYKVEGNKLTIIVDLSQNHGPSSTGKTDTVASSGGFQSLGDAAPGISISLNVAKKKPK